ncbi:hypothetical protein L2E82_37495 [Cichorium intybus]|uniref:Uncharacterized protein n=1 Tax=Cichorium intybus TaxID=13427 RepID=A0ACB9AEQ5_CICIN|nr:hypothetical protein L2E82_37495 [Cichorium intybus]
MSSLLPITIGHNLGSHKNNLNHTKARSHSNNLDFFSCRSRLFCLRSHLFCCRHRLCFRSRGVDLRSVILGIFYNVNFKIILT